MSNFLYYSFEGQNASSVDERRLRDKIFSIGRMGSQQIFPDCSTHQFSYESSSKGSCITCSEVKGFIKLLPEIPWRGRLRRQPSFWVSIFWGENQ